MRVVVLAWLVGWCVGCPAAHGPALPALPGQGGPAWIELQSEHFTLWTDASEERGRFLIREMEHLRQIVLGVGLASGEANGRSFVLALLIARKSACTCRSNSSPTPGAKVGRCGSR